MKKAFLSAAALVAALALPGAPALAQTNEITIGHGTCRGARHSRA
jgi:branched-chain amino acid transport system substrate-binding protein